MASARAAGGMASARAAVGFAVLAVVANVVFKRLTPDFTPWEWKASPMPPVSIPAPTELATGPWSPKPTVSEQAVQDFDRDGFVVLRQVVDPWAVDILLGASRRVCNATLEKQGWCHLKETRWSVDEYRDFLLHGPLGHITQAFVRRRAIRVLQEGAFAQSYVEANGKGPGSESLHVDDNGLMGIYGDLAQNTSAVTVWMPMHDIDFRVDGGGVELMPGFLQHECRSVGRYVNHFGFTTDRSEADCWQELESKMIVLDPLKKGDVLLFHPWLLHRTQRVLRPGFQRFALFAWFVDADAVACRPDFCDSTQPGKPCCRDPVMKLGARMHHPCYPQLHPSLLQDELDTMLEKRPNPMITPARKSMALVPYLCEDRAEMAGKLRAARPAMGEEDIQKTLR